MKKIRINELARELEVKPGAILDLLPEFGVSERKTHSSSIDEDVSLLVRARLLAEGGEGTLRPGAIRAEAYDETPETMEHPVEAKPIEPVAPAAHAVQAKPSPEPVATETPREEKHEAAIAHPAAKPAPIRPPLAAGGVGRPVTPPVAHVPTIPIPPRRMVPVTPVPPVVTAPPQATPPPAAVAPPPQPPPAPKPSPAVPAPPPPPPPQAAAPAPAAVTPGTPIRQAPPAAPPPGTPIRPSAPPPARPAPSIPRPGQILTGPRQPMPGCAAPGAPIVAPTPRPPGPPPQRPQASAPGVPPQRSPQAGQPMRPPMAGQPIVGQPAARPRVAPNPEILARLAQQQRATPGAPAAPRPGMPVPGQPLVPGLRRTGPGRPAPGGPPMGARPLRPRGPHPTAPVMEPPPTTDAGRRDAARKRAAARQREIEEGKLRPTPTRRIEELPQVNKEITISEGVTVKELSEKLGVRAALVIKQLLERKILVTINQTLDPKLAEELARAFGATTSKMSYEEEAVQEVELGESSGDLETRPPVVTIMGHVDHGKTSLLDAIRTANVAAKEAGGITQHIGAYAVELNNRKIVFIDTPGHEAFTRMRSRGAKVTDIVVLVVAADDGVMPQTREAIDHARAAKVPIIVAVNKIDKPDAQIDRVKQQLTDLGLMPEDWGGDTPFVPVSAKQKLNIELVLEMILLVADMQELKANPTRPAVATVLEAQVDRGRGPVATLLVRNGTLRSGEHYLCGTVFGRVRALFDDRGNPVKEAGPSMPVELIGLDEVPEVGDTLQVVTDLAKARQIAEFREQKIREVQMAKTRISLEQLHAQLREGESKELNVIIKADVGGSAEVLAETLQKLSTEKIAIRVLHTGVGAITETDVQLASASDAIIIGFNVRPDKKATEAAHQEKVDIRLHTIIYELTDEIKKAMLGMLDPVFKEVHQGRAEVRETFRITKVGTVAGCVVAEGTIHRSDEVRLLRDNVVIHTGRIDALKRFKNDASEVKSGLECGISLHNYHDIKPGDVIEAFVKERVNQDALV